MQSIYLLSFLTYMKMLYFEREFYIVKPQQSSSGRHPQHRPPHQFFPQHTALPPFPIYTFPYFRRSKPVPPPRLNHSHNHHHHLNCQRQFHPLLIQITHRATQSVTHLLIHLTIHLPTHLVTHLHSHPATHLPTFSTIHIITPLIQRQKIHPIL